jgi:hypothetical protein
VKGLAFELALIQSLAIGVALGSGVLERFAPKLPDNSEWLPLLMIQPGALKWYALGFAFTLSLALVWVERGKRRSGADREGADAGSRNASIDALYAELRHLMNYPEPDSELEIEQKLARLRALQQEEAAAMRRRYEARGDLQPGAGWRALSQARTLLSENENPASANSTLPKQA